jgi:hypothetical protein
MIYDKQTVSATEKEYAAIIILSFSCNKENRFRIAWIKIEFWQNWNIDNVHTYCHVY